MGLDASLIQFVCAAKSLGVSYSNILMVGSQLLFPEKSALQRIFSAQGIDFDATKFLQENMYDEKFSLIGLKKLIL